MNKHIKRYLSPVVIAVVFAACNEPYSVDPNANKDPVVEATFLMGHQPNGDDIQTPNGIVPYENFDFDSAHNVFNIYQSLGIRYNKLIKGDTVEKVDYKDPVTQRMQGDCNPPDGVFEIKEAGKPLVISKACYLVSDRLTQFSLRHLPTDKDPIQYFKYNTEYTISVSDKVKDKKGKSLTPYVQVLKTSPFRSMFFADSNEKVLWVNSKSTPIDMLESDKKNLFLLSARDTGIVADPYLKLIFNGPVNEDTAADLNANAKVFELIDGVERELIVNGTKAKFTTLELGEGDPVEGIDSESNPRAVALYHPSALLSEGKLSFKTGKYRVKIKGGAVIKDAGIVLDNNQRAASADGDLVIDFEIQQKQD